MPEPCSCPWYLIEWLPGKRGADHSSHEAALSLVRTVLNFDKKGERAETVLLFPRKKALKVSYLST